jgi:hypothetical protein
VGGRAQRPGGGVRPGGAARRWREILLLADRLASTSRLLPRTRSARAVLSLASTICDKGGLNWTRRLQLVHAGLQGLPGFNARASAYLAKKYGHDPKAAPRPARRWRRCWAGWRRNSRRSKRPAATTSSARR